MESFNLLRQGELWQQKRIRVLLADDHPVVRTGIKREIAHHDDIEIVGEASNGNEVLQLLQDVQSDILLLDINMPGLYGFEVLEQLNKLPPPATSKGVWPPHVLIFSAYCDREYVFSLFAAGAKGYLLKDELPNEVVAGIRDIVKGRPVLSPEVQKLLIGQKPTPINDLSERELEILQPLALGHSNQEIAAEFGIAESTVKNHIANIYKKIPEVKTRAEAVAWAWENSLVKKSC